MIDRDILEALQVATREACEQSILSSLPIKFLMRTFSIPDDQKYLEVIYIPNNVTGEFWGNEKTYRGIFRLMLHWPTDDRGAYPPMDLLASIAGYFTKEKQFSANGVTVQISEPPDFKSPLEAGHETLFSVSIRYICFQQ